MKRLIVIGLLAASAFAADRLADVRTIYIDSFGRSDGAEMIRQKFINRLAASDKISITEDRESADAILLGVGQVTAMESYSAVATTNNATAGGGTIFDATLVVRLVGRDKKILWVSEAKPGRFMARSVSSSVANKVSKDFLKAIKKAGN